MNKVKFAAALRKLNANAKKAVMHNPSMNYEYAQEVRQRLRDRIDSEVKGKDWGEGKQVNTGVTRATGKDNFARVTWTGYYVPFIEYGTGLEGYKHPYPGSSSTGELAMASADLDYSPEPYGHTYDEWWVFEAPNTPGRWVFSHGWEPMAPFFKTMMGEKTLAYTYYLKQLNRLMDKESRAFYKDLYNAFNS